MPGLELASSNSKLHPSYLDRRPVSFLGEGGIMALHTVHARVTHGARHAARPDLDDNVPQTCPCTGSPELWQAVPFCKEIRMIYEPKTPTFRKMEDTCYWYKITPKKENPGNRLIHSRQKKKLFERTPRATHCTDRGQTSTTVSGRPSSVVLTSLAFCANGARTKRYPRKHDQNFTNYKS